MRQNAKITKWYVICLPLLSEKKEKAKNVQLLLLEPIAIRELFTQCIESSETITE